MDGGQGDDTVRLTRAKAAHQRASDVPMVNAAGRAPPAPRRGRASFLVVVAGAVGLAGCALASLLLWTDDAPRIRPGVDAPGNPPQAGAAETSGSVRAAAGHPGQEIAGRQAPPAAPPVDTASVGSVSSIPAGPVSTAPAALPALVPQAPAALGTPVSQAPAALVAPVSPAAIVSAPAVSALVAPPSLAPAEPGPLRGMVVLPVPLPPHAPAPFASEAELLAATPERSVMLRLRENPAVFVLLFPTLDEQGRALNRIAALIEKAGQPRDRLLTDRELALAIEKTGETPATWYLGHDYQGSDLARFFALAERDGIPLNPAETWVRERFLEARALVPHGSEVALISTANSDQRFDPAMRAAILRHEISHGNFFTLPAVRAHVLKVWRDRFRERDRQAIRAFLEREGYDVTNELLMANEAMAYLLFTPDARFFSARLLGVTEAEVTRLRALMRDGLPLP